MTNFWKGFWSVVTLGLVGGGVYVATNDNNTTTTTSTTDSAKVVSVNYKQYVGVNGQINFNRVSYNDSGLMKAFDSLGVDFVRPFGGTYAESYNYLKDTPSLYSLAMFQNYTHCKYIFTLNTATSTLQNQIDMIRLARSLNLFTDTGYFEIGNEYVEPHDDNFLNKCKIWNDAIRKIYPTAQIGVPGGAPRKWNQSVLAKIPNVYIIDHYANPNDYVFNGITDTVAIGKMMDADRQTMFGGVPGNKIWVTEFNLVPANNNIQQFKDDEQKKIAVKFMLKKFQSYGFPIVLFHNIAMSKDNGALNSTAKGTSLSATGYAIREYTHR